jgi:prepilin-type N-terminal cleavage/methylation domain-containing protein
MLTMSPQTNRSEGGFTLVELLVVMMLLGVVGGVVTSAIISSMNSASRSTARIMATHELEIALQRVGRDLRGADPLFISDERRYGEHVGARFLRNRHMVVVSFELRDGEQQELVQETTTYDLDEIIDGGTPTVVETQHTLVTTVDNGDEPVFRYYDRAGDELTCDPATEGGSYCDGVYASAKRIGIHVVRDVAGQTPVRADTQVSVRNTRYQQDG